ncbi:MAG: AMP-binding protein [Gammaproteobacteria bacterium]|nr:AMP-binding protein [Gammaproteobacteria bacterium]
MRTGVRPADAAVAARYGRAGWWDGPSLLDRFESHVARSPEALALASGEVTLSRSELWSAAGEAAETIRGVAGPGRRVVVLLLPNETAWLVMFLAVLRAGQVPATPPVTTTANQLRHIFELTEPALAITVSTHRKNAPAETVRRAAAGAADVVVGLAEGRFLEFCGARGDSATGAPGSRVDVDEATAHLMFTSGTTGPPKVVSHSEDTLATLNLQFAERFSLGPHTPVFMPSPLGHSVGAIHGARLSMFLGAPLILQDQWHAEAALDLVSRHHAAFTAAATPFLFDLANAPWHGREPKLAPLKTFLCGGAQVPPALIRRCRTEFPNTFVTPLWGMTEGGLTTCVADSTDEQVETTVGVGLPGLELRTLADDLRLQVSGAGELVMRGPGVFNGYYGQPETYAGHLIGDGFFRTGDLARIDADGYVSIVGRVKDLIIRGGVNISPVATENAIAAHPDVVGVAVIGWPDERLGERLCAAVEARAPLTLADILTFCEAQGLARRYWPERLEPVERFPRTAAGKIRKHELLSRLLDRATAAGGNGSGDAGPRPGEDR